MQKTINRPDLFETKIGHLDRIMEKTRKFWEKIRFSVNLFGFYCLWYFRILILYITQTLNLEVRYIGSWPVLLRQDSWILVKFSEFWVVLDKGGVEVHKLKKNSGTKIQHYNPSNLFARDWSKHVTWPNISQFSKLRALRKRFER